jgi:hypothetical protein
MAPHARLARAAVLVLGVFARVALPDFEDIASECVRYAPGHTNNQHALSTLIRDGHYLGYWSSSDERLPQLVYDNVRLAINYQLLYPRWLFFCDFSAEPAAKPRPSQQSPTSVFS